MAGLLSPAPCPRDAVAETVARWAMEPFAWGEADCAMSVLRYIEGAIGRGPILRPYYGTAATAARYANRRGGFAAICANVMDREGFERIASPDRGDVGLVELPAIGLTACLCVGPGMWAAKGDRQVVIAPGTATLAWRLPCPRP